MEFFTTDLIAKYKKYLIREEKSQATLEKYIRDITAFKAWMKNDELTKEKVLDYKKYLTENYAPSSVNSMLSAINSFFDYNEWYELRVRSLRIQKKIFADKDRELSKTEYERLLKAAKEKNNNKLNMLIQTICSTGIRVSELRFITVSSVKSGQATINCKGKMRIVILPKELCRILIRYVREHNILSGPVFVSRNGKPLDRSNIWRLMKSLCDYADVPKNKVFPHNLRHLFARTYYSLEKDIVRLADILGHSSVNTTRIYTMENSDIHRQQIQKLGLLVC